MSDHFAHRTLRVILTLSLLGLLFGSCGGCSGPSVVAGSTAAGMPGLAISTTSLPNGQAGKPYSATLRTSGGTAPTSWSLSAGALPAGLALDAASGTLTGTPSVTTPGTALTFTATDSATPANRTSVTLPITISPADITLTVSPARAAITLAQTLTFSAATNDYGGVSWSVSAAGGAISPAAGASGAHVTYTPPGVPGAYTITATSVTDPDLSASVTVGVTDLQGVYTYHNDLARSGVNAHEFALNPGNVSGSSFGKLFACPVDAAVYAEPLWMANLGIGGARHNVVFVATSNDSLYAFDADAAPCRLLWRASLIDAQHGGSGGEITNDDFGIIGTPVIDPASGILYAVTRSLNGAGTMGYQRLHAIDTASGAEKAGSPVAIAATYSVPGTMATFDPLQHLQRAGLALANGSIYVAFGSNDDRPPWYGWMMAYTYSTQSRAFRQTAVLNTTPVLINGEHGGGIWMSGGAPAVDGSGNLFATTGNGSFNASTAGASGPDYGDCLLQLGPTLQVKSFFSPSDQASDDLNDLDFGASGATMVISPSGGPLKHLIVGGGKDGALYVLDGDNLGGAGDAHAVQAIALNAAIFSNGAFWNNTLYIGPVGAPLQAYVYDNSTGLFPATWTTQSKTSYGFPGASPSISAAGSSADAVVWSIDSSANCLGHPCGPAILHAYSATDLAVELWNSSVAATDAAGNAVKFTVPTIANGRVYVGTRGNNTGSGSSTIPGELDVYGLKP